MNSISPLRALWLIAGAASLLTGLVGVFLPLLPTVPFLLLAAYCFSRSSQHLHDWMLNHPRFGPPIRDWRDHGAIPATAKRYATLSIGAAFLISIWLQVPIWALSVQALVLATVSLFIWTRPDR